MGGSTTSPAYTAHLAKGPCNKSCKLANLPRYIDISSWWLNQPVWKRCYSNWIISPSRANMNKNWNHHLQVPWKSTAVLEMAVPFGRWWTLGRNGNLPQVRVKITHIWNHHLVQYTDSLCVCAHMLPVWVVFICFAIVCLLSVNIPMELAGFHPHNLNHQGCLVFKYTHVVKILEFSWSLTSHSQLVVGFNPSETHWSTR